MIRWLFIFLTLALPALAGGTPGQPHAVVPFTSAPLLAFTALANGTVGGSPIAGSGTYTGTAPTSISTATWGGGCSGSSTPAGFSASTGTWSATFTVPSGAGTGCTIAITDNRSDTATSPGVTISSGGSPIALIASGEIAGGTNGGTSPGINTTGANLLIMVCGYYSSGSVQPPVVSDSLGNTWTPLTIRASGAQANQIIYYAKNATVGAGQTFTSANALDYQSTEILAFSNTNASSPFDVENGHGDNTGATTLQPGSVTPANANSVVVTGFSTFTAQTMTINGGFTITTQQSTGAVIGAAAAYLIQTTATAANPTWTASATTNGQVATIAVFHQ